jgi:hypothetical protein
MASSATVVDARVPLMSRVIVSMVGGTVPMTGALLEARMFDLSFTGPVARLRRSARLPPVIPALETSLGRPPPRDDVLAAGVQNPPVLVPRAADLPFDKLHWAVYAELGKQGITITGLSSILANLRGTTKLDDAFTGNGIKAVSIGSGHDLQDWAVDAALVPYHVAGCLSITYYIMRKPSAMTFHAFYERYRGLVGEMVLLCEGDTDGAIAREFANVILHHAGTTSAYVGLFLSMHRVTKFGAGFAHSLNETWINKLFHAMSRKISEVRLRTDILRTLHALLATHGF